MAGRAIDRRGIQSIMEGVDLYRTPYISVWEGRVLKFSCTDNDMDSSADVLRNNLEAMLQSGTDALYTIRFHAKPDKDGYITDKTSATGSFNFKVSDQPAMLAGIGMAGIGGMDMRRAAPIPDERINAMESRLSAIEDSLDEAEEPQDNGMGAIGALLNNPIVQQLAGVLLGGRAAAPAGIAGIPNEQDEKINRAIPILKRHAPALGDNLMSLAKLAEADPSKFNGLLSMLSML